MSSSATACTKKTKLLANRAVNCRKPDPLGLQEVETSGLQRQAEESHLANKHIQYENLCPCKLLCTLLCWLTFQAETYSNFRTLTAEVPGVNARPPPLPARANKT